MCVCPVTLPGASRGELILSAERNSILVLCSVSVCVTLGQRTLLEVT